MGSFLSPILGPIEQVLFELLKWLQGFVGDWGVAIILLTVIVRVLLIPLTWKQTKSMVEMQRIQPKLKALQEKYKNDKEKQQEEILKFYQEHKVNPLGGCLPLLLQLPILFALFGVLGKTNKGAGLMLAYLEKIGRTASFLFILPDISKTPQQVFSAAAQAGHSFFAGVIGALPYLIFVILFGLSIWLPQALMPGDRQQKMIGGYMAIAMLYFGWVSPAGVLLYWVTTSIWGLGQQQLTMSVMNRQQRALEQAAPEAAEAERKAAEPKEKTSGQSPKPAGAKKRKK